MRQLRLLLMDGRPPEESFVLIQDIESKLYFVWRQPVDEQVARDTMETIAESWERDPFERGKDLQVNFVNAIDRTLLRPAR